MQDEADAAGLSGMRRAGEEVLSRKCRDEVEKEAGRQIDTKVEVKEVEAARIDFAEEDGSTLHTYLNFRQRLIKGLTDETKSVPRSQMSWQVVDERVFIFWIFLCSVFFNSTPVSTRVDKNPGNTVTSNIQYPGRRSLYQGHLSQR